MEVYIILTDTGTFFTRLIKLFTRKPLNHASISFSSNLERTYSFGRKKPHNPFIGGFVRERLRDELFRCASCAIYRCTVSETEYKKMLQYIKQIEKQKQKYKYNFIGLFGVLFNKEFHRKNAFFCSEFVAAVLQNGGITIKNKPVSLVRPNDFSEIRDSRLVFKGKLSSYPLLYRNQYCLVLNDHAISFQQTSNEIIF